MPKIVLEISVPSNDKKYEMVVDDRIIVSDLADKLSRQLSAYDKTAKISRSNILLADKTTKTLLDENYSLKDQNVRSGDTIIVI